MGIETIKRVDGEEHKQGIYGNYKKVQISFNSDGHLVIRLVYEDNNDALIVCDRNISDKVIEFCQEELKDRENMEVPF